MGSLTRIAHLDLHKSVAALAELGVTEEEFDEIRTKPVVARRVAELLKEQRKWKEAAWGTDEQVAMEALKHIYDVETLWEVAKNTPLHQIAMHIASNGSSELSFVVASSHRSPEVFRAAVKNVSRGRLHALLIAIPPSLEERREFVRNEIERDRD